MHLKVELIPTNTFFFRKIITKKEFDLLLKITTFYYFFLSISKKYLKFFKKSVSRY